MAKYEALMEDMNREKENYRKNKLENVHLEKMVRASCLDDLFTCIMSFRLKIVGSSSKRLT